LEEGYVFMVKIAVCMKLVIDPEVTFSSFKIDRKAIKPIPPEGMPPVINPFDENALEAALKIKDEQDTKITVISLGRSLPKAILQRALAVGADEVIGLEGPDFDHLDPFSTARALAKAIKKIGGYDLVFTGRQAADWDAGIVWAGIAETLDLPSVTIARKIKIKDGKAIVERVTSDGIEIVEVNLPALINFSNEVGELRPFSLPNLIKVKKIEIPKWSGSDVDLENVNLMETRDFYIPDLGLVDCQFITGESAEEKGRNLARKLAEEQVISLGS
jgi:electron transfer flavoprotein beta subunit